MEKHGTKVLAICGLGGSGCEILDLATRINKFFCKWSDIIFIDKYDHEKCFRGYKVFNIDEVSVAYDKNNLEFVISVGDVYLREKIFLQVKELGYKLTNLISPTVTVPQSVKIGCGVIIKDFSYISVDIEVDDNVIIQSNTSIGHNVHIGKHSIVSSQSVLAGGVDVGTRTYVAIGCMIKELIKIGSDSIISMGSVVNANMSDNVIVQGNPAKVISKNYLKSAFRLNSI